MCSKLRSVASIFLAHILHRIWCCYNAQLNFWSEVLYCSTVNKYILKSPTPFHSSLLIELTMMNLNMICCLCCTVHSCSLSNMADSPACHLCEWAHIKATPSSSALAHHPLLQQTLHPFSKLDPILFSYTVYNNHRTKENCDNRLNKTICLRFGHTVMAVISPLMGCSITITLKYLSRHTKGLIQAGVAAGIRCIDEWRAKGCCRY